MSARREQAERGDPEREGSAGEAPADEPVPSSVLGERGVASVHRIRSIQSRVSSLLALSLMVVLGGGLLTWYYAHMFAWHEHAQAKVVEAARARASGDAPLPSPGRFDPPPMPATPAAVSSSPGPASAPTAPSAMLGPPPVLPAALIAGTPASLNPPLAPAFGGTGSATMNNSASLKTPGQLAFERRLTGPAFAASSEEGAGVASEPSSEPTPVATGSEPNGQANPSAVVAANRDQRIAALLTPTATPAVRASVLPTGRFLIPKGTFIDCTLETAIDSTLPGMTTCITATDTFSADGEVVLLERGTKLIGETRGEVEQGQARIFVLWTEARTPSGVVVPLDSPGTDELGRSGLSGTVNRHFWQRFGAAMLVSVIDGAVQAAMASSESNGNTVILSPSASTDVIEEVLKGTINIPPTVTKNQGDRIEVLVARDLDFRSVYELRSISAPSR